MLSRGWTASSCRPLLLLGAIMLSTFRRASSFITQSRQSASLLSSAMSSSSSSSSTSSSPSGGLAYTSVFVKGSLTPGAAAAFYKHTLSNAQNSILEQGIARFDLLRRIDLPPTPEPEPEGGGEFLLVEVYRHTQAPEAHKQTQHYAAWRDAVAPFMGAPRQAAKYSVLFPPSRQWATSPAASTIDAASYSEALPWSSVPLFPTPGASLSGSSSAAYADRALLAVVVHVRVKPADRGAFEQATLLNCRSSIREGGVTRFDFLQDQADPCHYLLVEVYNSPEAPAEHQKTKHYAAWAETVKDMMATPRSAERYATLYPPPLYWHTSSVETHKGEGAVPDIDSISGSDGSRGLSTVSGNSFGFLSPKILMGRGIAAQAIKSALKEAQAQSPLLVTGKSGYHRLSEVLIAALGEEAYANLPRYAVSGEPTTDDASAALALAVERNCDSVLSIGGGSAIDLGKAVSALMTNPGSLFDYIEVVGLGKAITHAPKPFIAVPTTAGTGSEVTKNAVLKSVKHGRKASIRADSMLPRAAIIDPLLTLTCPADVTAHVGLDTLCQVVEPYTSNAANPFTDALCKEAILRSSRSLRTAVADGSNVQAREDLSIASVMSGLALANARLGAVHGYAAVLGGMFELAPHGAICACLTPHVFQANAEKLSALAASASDAERATALARLGRFDDVARIVTGNPQASWQDGVAWLHALVRDTRVPGLRQLCGLQENQIAEVAAATREASSTKGNPVTLSQEDLEGILRSAL